MPADAVKDGAFLPIIHRLTTAATGGLAAARRKRTLALQRDALPPARPTESGLIRPNPTQSDPTQYDLIRVDPTESDRVKPVSDCKCTMSGEAIRSRFSKRSQMTASAKSENHRFPKENGCFNSQGGWERKRVFTKRSQMKEENSGSRGCNPETYEKTSYDV